MLLRKRSLRRSVNEQNAMRIGRRARAGIVLGRSHDETFDVARHEARCGGTAAATQATAAGATGGCARHAARIGLQPSLACPDLLFPSDSAETADALVEQLGHNAFRSFVRGVIHHGDGFTPSREGARV